MLIGGRVGREFLVILGFFRWGFRFFFLEELGVGGFCEGDLGFRDGFFLMISWFYFRLVVKE